MNQEIKQEQDLHLFQNIYEWKIPENFITAKRVLISKDRTQHSLVSKIRPIIVLPSVTKIFKLSIQYNLEAFIQSLIFNKIEDDS